MLYVNDELSETALSEMFKKLDRIHFLNGKVQKF